MRSATYAMILRARSIRLALRRLFLGFTVSKSGPVLNLFAKSWTHPSDAIAGRIFWYGSRMNETFTISLKGMVFWSNHVSTGPLGLQKAPYL